MQVRCKRYRFNPWIGRSPGEGNGNPLQYSCLENLMDRVAWWATVHRVAKSWRWLKRLHTPTELFWLSIHGYVRFQAISEGLITDKLSHSNAWLFWWMWIIGLYLLSTPLYIYIYTKVKVWSHSVMSNSVIVACQAPLAMAFSRQEYWSGLPFPSPMHESEKWKWSRSVVSNSS